MGGWVYRRPWDYVPRRARYFVSTPKKQIAELTPASITLGAQPITVALSSPTINVEPASLILTAPFAVSGNVAFPTIPPAIPAVARPGHSRISTRVANAALILLGERRLEDLNSSSRVAKVVCDRLGDVRDAVLRMRLWGEAMTRTELASRVETPAWGYENVFSHPYDSLRLVKVEHDGFPWRVVGDRIYTSHPAPLRIVYARRLDPSEMGPGPRQVLSAALAVEVGPIVTGSTSKVEAAYRVLLDRLRTAASIDGQEQSPTDLAPGEWLDSRGDY